MIAAIVRVPAPWGQIDRLGESGNAPNDTPNAQRFIESHTTPGEHILLIGTPVDHRLADRAGVTNVSPLNGFISLFSPSEADRSLDQLRDEGGDEVFEAATAPSAINPSPVQDRRVRRHPARARLPPGRAGPEQRPSRLAPDRYRTLRSCADVPDGGVGEGRRPRRAPGAPRRARRRPRLAWADRGGRPARSGVRMARARGQGALAVPQPFLLHGICTEGQTRAAGGHPRRPDARGSVCDCRLHPAARHPRGGAALARPRDRRAQIAASAMLVLSTLRQPHTLVPLPTDYLQPYLVSAPNLVAGLCVGLILTGLVLWWSGPPPGLLRTLARRADRLWLVLSLALLITIVFLLPAVITDASVGHNGLWTTKDVGLHAEDYFAVINGRTPMVDYIGEYANLLPFAVAPVLRRVRLVGDRIHGPDDHPLRGRVPGDLRRLRRGHEASMGGARPLHPIPGSQPLPLARQRAKPPVRRQLLRHPS